MRILLVEDDDYKSQSILEFLAETFGTKIDVVLTTSVHDAISALLETHYDLAIVDMSLPSYSNAGSRPLGFGGADILRYVSFLGSSTPCVVLTQYEEFQTSDGLELENLAALKARLMLELDSVLMDVVHYSATADDWRHELGLQIEKYLRPR